MDARSHQSPGAGAEITICAGIHAVVILLNYKCIHLRATTQKYGRFASTKNNQKWTADASTGCWQWHGTYGKPSARYEYKYGQFLINGVTKRAHRTSWELHRGPIPKGLNVLHRCNNAICVNPEHLYLGTHQQNMRDMAISLRSGHLKLMPDEVRTIRVSKESSSILALRYGVDRSTIKDIKNFKTRKHVG